MKKTLLTLGVVAAFAAGASAQGLLYLTGAAGFNTATSNPNAPTSGGGWYSGNVTLQVFTIAAAGNSTLATTLNTEFASLGSATTAFSAISGSGSWTLQDVGTDNGAATTEAASQTINILGGGINNTSQGNYYVGTSATLPESSDIYYALLFTTAGGLEGGVVMNNPAAGYLPSTSPVNNMNSEYPVDAQNVVLAPVPEPTTLALAGLGGLSMLFLRRRKA